MGCGNPIGAVTGTDSFGKGANLAYGSTKTAQRLAQANTEKAVDLMNPYAQAGTEALDMYKNMVLGGDMSSFHTSPGYQFRLGEGINASDRSAASMGGLQSGAQMKALNDYSQGMASNEYANYQNSLGNLMGQGFSAAGAQGGYYSGLGSQLGSMYSQLGNTQANMYGQKAGAVGEMFGGGLGIAGQLGAAKIGAAGAAAAAAASDIRVKDNINYTGETTKDGIAVIEFNYKEGYGYDPKQRYRGVIAQEVEKVKPEAVIEEDGIKKVIYDMLDFKMEAI